jgi:uncharacterized lipoprotein YehR (DUF1307 family)
MTRVSKIIAILLVLSLTGCGDVDRFFASVTGDDTPTCWKGVTYIRFTSDAPEVYSEYGTIMLCE